VPWPRDVGEAISPRGCSGYNKDDQQGTTHRGTKGRRGRGKVPKAKEGGTRVRSFILQYLFIDLIANVRARSKFEPSVTTGVLDPSGVCRDPKGKRQAHQEAIY
jgi:hypothetical protein